jgi:hypothetical protein
VVFWWVKCNFPFTSMEFQYGWLIYILSLYTLFQASTSDWLRNARYLSTKKKKEKKRKKKSKGVSDFYKCRISVINTYIYIIMTIENNVCMYSSSQTESSMDHFQTQGALRFSNKIDLLPIKKKKIIFKLRGKRPSESGVLVFYIIYFHLKLTSCTE